MINANSIPVYNYSYLANLASFGGSAVYTDAVRNEPVWTCENWISFFAALKNEYGEEQARDTWTKYWLMGLSKSAGGQGDPRAGSGYIYDSVPLDCRSFNTAFRAFIQKYNLSDVVYKGLGNITKPIGVGVDVVSNVSDAAVTASKVIKYVVPIGIVVITLLITYRIYKITRV